MKTNLSQFRRLEINGGRVEVGETVKFVLPTAVTRYTDAQIDDYGRCSHRRHYPWHTGTALQLKARFSHAADQLQGTAGFGFWNAPFGDPTIRWPALPQAIWFFFASAPSDLPFPRQGKGQGWFVATLDATTLRAFSLAFFTPFILLLNQFATLRQCVWPFIRHQLQISYTPLYIDMRNWHQYQLYWRLDGCSFLVDQQQIWHTPYNPSGPMGFVSWIDNQYMIATPTGRFKWGTVPIAQSQWLEIADLKMQRTAD